MLAAGGKKTKCKIEIDNNIHDIQQMKNKHDQLKKIVSIAHIIFLIKDFIIEKIESFFYHV